MWCAYTPVPSFLSLVYLSYPWAIPTNPIYSHRERSEKVAGWVWDRCVMSWDRTRQVLGQKLEKGRDKARIARDRPGFTEKAEKLDKSEKG